jgi:CubicO group peptidase (beta-lactamase class C family)
MRVRTPLMRVALFVMVASVCLIGRSLRAQDDAPAIIARLDAPQSPNRQGLDGLTLREVMQRVRVPGVSIAVIRNFTIHWAKGYGVADVETGRPVRDDTMFQAFKYSGGGFTIMQLALTDLVGDPFAQMMQTRVLAPLGMTNSSFEQPLPDALAARAARAHNAQGQRMDAPWHVYPEQAAAGLWTTPSDLARFAIEVQRALRGASGTVLTQAMAREMVTPTGVGPFAVGFTVEKRNEGWYLIHGGANWGFRCSLVAHVRKGYGMVVMTNGDAGATVNTEIEARVASAYGWDSLDKPLIQ